MQIGEIIGNLPNKECKGARGDILMDIGPSTRYLHQVLSPSLSSYEDDDCEIIVPRIEIPSWFNFNHKSFLKSILFLDGREIPKITICIAFGEELVHTRGRYYQVYLSINGCEKKHHKSISNDQIHDHLWLFSISSQKLQEQLNICLKEFNDFNMHWCLMAVPPIIKRWGIHVECICCPEKSGIACLPFSSARRGGCSSSVTYDTNSLPFQSVFPTSWGSNIYHEISNNEGVLGLSMEKNKERV